MPEESEKNIEHRRVTYINNIVGLEGIFSIEC